MHIGKVEEVIQHGISQTARRWVTSTLKCPFSFFYPCPPALPGVSRGSSLLSAGGKRGKPSSKAALGLCRCRLPRRQLSGVLRGCIPHAEMQSSVKLDKAALSLSAEGRVGAHQGTETDPTSSKSDTVFPEKPLLSPESVQKDRTIRLRV